MRKLIYLISESKLPRLALNLLRRCGGLDIDGGKGQTENNFIGVFQICLFLHRRRIVLDVSGVRRLVCAGFNRRSPPGEPYGDAA